MVGSVQVNVRNNRVQYKFELKRNITVLRGDSATGKTTLIELIDAYLNYGNSSGVELSCDKKCYVLSGNFWYDNLKSIKDSIVFIDEGNAFLTSKEFAKAISKSDNYYVIATRNPLSNLPYSVDEIYRIKNNTRGYGIIKRVYSSFERIYQTEYEAYGKFTSVIVEDSNSGYQFFNAFFKDKGINCISARGKSNIYSEILKLPREEYVLIIADGAAFGAEIERVLSTKLSRHICLFLPESFEWIILNSGVIEFERNVLEHTEKYVDSKKYFSWERFFEAFLREITTDTYLEYKKSKLNPNYLKGKAKKSIIDSIPNEIKKNK